MACAAGHCASLDRTLNLTVTLAPWTVRDGNVIRTFKVVDPEVEA
jgi:hypothetical protein